MRKTNLTLIGLVLGGSIFMSSCSKDKVECHECHIAYEADGAAEVEVEIGEFCGEALEEAENPGYTYELTEDYISDGDTVPAGVYGNGNMEIHCEEHAH